MKCANKKIQSDDPLYTVNINSAFSPSWAKYTVAPTRANDSHIDYYIYKIFFYHLSLKHVPVTVIP